MQLHALGCPDNQSIHGVLEFLTFETLGMVLMIDVPHKAIILEQLMGGMLEVREGLGQTAIAGGQPTL